jgi:hypothetical protein
MKRTISPVFIVILSLALTGKIFAQHDFNPRPIHFNQTIEQWREDLRYFAAELPKRHKNAFHFMTREQFAAEVGRLDKDIPMLSAEQIFVRFLQLIAMVGDGHTSIEEQSLLGLGLYPLRYEFLEDGLFVQSASAEYREIVGGKVVGIENLPIAEVLPKIREISWGDSRNEQALKVETAFLLSSPKVLQGLKIGKSDDKISVAVEKDGQVKTLEVKAVKDVVAYFRDDKRANVFDGSSNPTPLYLKSANDPYWFEYLSDKQILYVQFNAVVNKPNQSIEVFFRKVFDFAGQNNVAKFVLDVRGNTGGNNQLNKPIILGLIKAKFNERGKLFVITGRRTFSAAQNLVNEIEKYTNAIFVGEPTGSSPNLYGDPVIMTLPHSKMPFRVSTLWHQIEARDTRVFTVPEIFAPLTSADLRNNIDPAFQAIVGFVPGSTFKDLTAAAHNTDITVFISKYREFKTDPKNRFVNTETETNAFGYRLLQAGRVKDAVEVFRLNVEDYPKSANVYDSLGEALAVAGLREEAIKNYERALQINPDFASSQDALRRLKGN